jgi:protein-disulfide isomerase
MIFPLDSEVKVEMVKILMGKYNITSFPSIVVLGKKYEGIVSKEEVEKLILQQLS